MSPFKKPSLTAKEKLRPISGFPELLPEERRVELDWIDQIRTIFESYGFTSIEPRIVEPIDVLLKQGDTDKEIYTLGRLLDTPNSDKEPTFGLHYDLTIPMARYVAANMGKLDFPFKRYQIQKAWRGERPQDGRFREFMQCDIDVVDTREVPLHFDVEIPAIMNQALKSIDAGPVFTKINNRKILEGYYSGLDMENTSEAIRLIDKVDKIGFDGVADLLKAELELNNKTIDKIFQLTQIHGSGQQVVDQIQNLGVHSELLDQGLTELTFVMQEL